VPQVFIPLPEAARRLALPYRRVWEAFVSRRLDGERRGGRVFVTVASLERIRNRAAIAGKQAPARPEVIAGTTPRPR
jgi:hypothetical protein